MGRMMDGYGDKVSWEDIKRAMREKLVPPYYQDQQFEKLVMLKQGHKSVEEYAKVFETLVRRSGLNESPLRVISRFMNGLNYNIAKNISHLNFHILQEAIQAALRIEISLSIVEMAQKSKLLLDTMANNLVDTHAE